MPNIMEGVFAINKPPHISSFQVLQDLQKAFNPSALFAPWLAAEKSYRASLNKYQRNRRKDKRLKVKLGHGGTLDPMATGVLIVGVGKGTKQLKDFLECTKSYEATVLFGVATDTYDVLGKVLGKAQYSQITREGVEKALEKFRGEVMQRPPIYSALRMQGKRLYEYAREGKEPPTEIQERPVEVKELEVMEWLPSGSHSYKWPTEEAPTEEKEVAEKVLHIGSAEGSQTENPQATEGATAEAANSGTKRKRLYEEDDVYVSEKRSASKCQDEDSPPSMSGGIPPPPSNTAKPSVPSPATHSPNSKLLEPVRSSDASPSPPAIKLFMTVTSGFYVRSLSHDLGSAVSSLGAMSSLVRTRQGEFALGKNVLEYEDLEKGEDVWGPQVERMLREWNENSGERNSSPDKGDRRSAKAGQRGGGERKVAGMRNSSSGGEE